jgi:hypothetical protein
MRILQLKSARAWSCEQAARAFLVDEQTLRSWMRRIDEQGERALIQIADPVNRFPDFVRYLVKQLKTLLPSMGKVRIAQLLARAGLHLGATTIARIARETEPLPDDAFAAAPEIDIATTRVVTAKHPGAYVAYRSHGRSDLERILGSMDAIRGSAILAFLLVGRRRCGSFLTSRGRFLGFLQASNLRRNPTVSRPGHSTNWWLAQVRHHRQG